jgi:hypothetical protein
MSVSTHRDRRSSSELGHVLKPSVETYTELANVWLAYCRLDKIKATLQIIINTWKHVYLQQINLCPYVVLNVNICREHYAIIFFKWYSKFAPNLNNNCSRQNRRHSDWLWTGKRRGLEFRVPVGSRIFSSPRRPDRLWGPPSLLANGHRG